MLLVLLVLLVLPACSSDDGASAAECASDPTVSDAGELQDALDDAGPGSVIVLADGEYAGAFTAEAAGTRAEPVTLCGSRDARLVGRSIDEGYTLHLDGASYWRVEGFSVEGGQKGVMLDDASHNELRDLRITGTGDEALHLRTGSSDNLVTGVEIRRTGLREPEYGEGIYVGTAESNWCDLTDCEPDRSDDNRIVGNDVRQTSAEAVDLKEGTTGGELRDNVLHGGTGAVDSVVDVKGNDWVVRDNELVSEGPDAISVHVILEGWGEGNRFVGNSFQLARPGYAVHLVGAAEGADNVVGCSQPMAPSGVGEISNVDCR
jgi:hypothetical protein